MLKNLNAYLNWLLKIGQKINHQDGYPVRINQHQNSVEIITISGSVRDLKGMVAKSEHVISLAEMDLVIREQAE